ncbi:dihydroneopterin aldolase [soil metagenome]
MADALFSRVRPATAFAGTVEVMVTGLQVQADIGVYAHEHGRSQLLSVEVTVEVLPPESDSMDASLDYQDIVEAAQALGRERIGLIETYARRLAESCMANPCARRALVRVDKPGALRNGLAGARVTMTRVSD